MRLSIHLVSAASEGPPVGALVAVQVRDTTFEDAPAPVIAQAEALVSQLGQLPTVELEIDELPASAIVWAMVDVDRDGRLSRGDYLTTVSYPISADGPAEMTIVLRQI